MTAPLREQFPRSQTRIQSVSRAVALLLAIAQSRDGMTAKELADRFGMSTPTTHHLLTTLWAEGMVMKDERRIFRLGHHAGLIAEAYQRSDTVPAAFHEVLENVVRKTGETAYLSAWRGSSVKVLATLEGAHAVRVAGLVAGYSDHLHARASGKLLLAFASDDLRAQVTSELDFAQLTPNTITDSRQLDLEITDVLSRGFAFDRQEFQLGVDCVSAPLRVDEQVVACITVSVPTHRFDEEGDTILANLIAATSAATAAEQA